MSEDRLRRNLRMALDPGPGFPDPAVLSRTMSAIAREAPATRRRPPRSARLLGGVLGDLSRNRFLAAALIIVTLLAAAGAFVLIEDHSRRLIPVHIHPSASYCSIQNRAPFDTLGVAARMLSLTTGWRVSTDNRITRTADGGRTWQDVTPPSLPNSNQDVANLCALDADTAWVAEAIGPPGQLTSVAILATTDGGSTWREGGSVPFDTQSGDLGLMQFVDRLHGWLLIGTSGTQRLYRTADGGNSWSVLSAEVGNSTNCQATGLTFINLDRGWLTWDCTHVGSGPIALPGGNRQINDSTSAPSRIVLLTENGGRTWSEAQLPEIPDSIGSVCAAIPPAFSNDQGLMPIFCEGTHGTAALLRTTDGGATWQSAPTSGLYFSSNTITVADASTAFAYMHIGQANDLYRTTNAGRSWDKVASGIFKNQAIGDLQFIDASNGFAYTTTSTQVPWTTVDGGRTWIAPYGVRAVPGNVACGVSRPSTSPPTPILMVDANTAWAEGVLRTTDGGASWKRLAPPDVPNRASGAEEFYLDGAHAWVAEAAGSGSACVDHLIVWSTSDGGRTWVQSDPITIPFPADLAWPQTYGASSRTAANPPWLDFVNPLDGWLLLQSGTLGSVPVVSQGPLYGTTDGGRHWRVMSSEPYMVLRSCSDANSGLRFSSPTTGWAAITGCDPGNSDFCGYDVTHDGGVTWDLQTVQSDRCSLSVPTFLDRLHGRAQFGDPTGSLAWIVTSDGGANWSVIRSDQQSYYFYDFLDMAHGWMITDGPNSTYELLATSNGGAHWSLVNANLPSSTGTPRGAQFSDLRHGLLSTDGGALYATGDGGRTWVQLTAAIS